MRERAMPSALFQVWRSHGTRSIFALMVVSSALAGIPAYGQFAPAMGPPSGRSFFGRGGGMAGTAREPDVQKELRLTDEQIRQIDEISEQSRAASRELFSQFGDLREASPEERDARMAEIRKQMEARQRETDLKLKPILSAEQFARLEQVTLQRAGASALLQSQMVADLKITDEQQGKLREVLEARFEGDRSQMTAEGFQKWREERDAKALALLTEDQRKAFDAKLGPKSVIDPAATVPAVATATPVVGTIPPSTVPMPTAAGTPPAPASARIGADSGSASSAGR